jgi:SAM-dependent methyltransferase
MAVRKRDQRLRAAVREAYDRTGAAWDEGPAVVHDRLADVVVARSPVPLGGRLVLDVGSGTGAASLAAAEVGARVVAVDLSPAMLRANRAPLVGRVAGDAAALPLADRSVGGVIAAFSFDHLADPAAAFAEAARVCRPGAPVLVAAHAADEDHPVESAVDRAAAEAGWTPPAWYVDLREHAASQLGSEDGMAAAVSGTGLRGEVAQITVDLHDLTAKEMIAWRMGMPQLAPYLAATDHRTHERVRLRAIDLLGPSPPPLRRSVVVFAGTA